MLDKLFKFVKQTCVEFSIDESHGLTHSIQVYRYGQEIYSQVLKTDPQINELEQVIVCACILHDMCDYKYMNERVGVERIVELLNGLELDQYQINLIVKIITTMSYTKIKAHGFPEFDNPTTTLAFNIVREADLLAAYDFDRSVVYAMLNKKMLWLEAIDETIKYFKIRVLQQISDGMFLTKFGLEKAYELHKQNLSKVYI